MCIAENETVSRQFEETMKWQRARVMQTAMKRRQQDYARQTDYTMLWKEGARKICWAFWCAYYFRTADKGCCFFRLTSGLVGLWIWKRRRGGGTVRPMDSCLLVCVLLRDVHIPKLTFDVAAFQSFAFLPIDRAMYHWLSFFWLSNDDVAVFQRSCDYQARN